MRLDGEKFPSVNSDDSLPLIEGLDFNPQTSSALWRKWQRAMKDDPKRFKCKIYSREENPKLFEYYENLEYKRRNNGKKPR